MKLLVPKQDLVRKVIAPFLAVVLTLARRALRAESLVEFEKPDTYVYLETESLSSPRVGSQFWPLARRSSRRKALTSFIDVGKSAAFVEAEVLR